MFARGAEWSLLQLERQVLHYGLLGYIESTACCEVPEIMGVAFPDVIGHFPRRVSSDTRLFVRA